MEPGNSRRFSFSPSELLVNGNCAALEVHAGPLEAENLALPHSYEQIDLE